MKLKENNMIIGDKSVFGIEIDLTRKENMLIPLRLFIQGKPLGTLDDYTYASSFINNFIFKLDKLFDLNIDQEHKSKSNIFNYIHSLDDNLEKYKLKLGDSFDDYCIYIYTYNKKAYLTWKVINNPFFTYPKTQMNKIFSFEVNIFEVRKVIEQLKMIITM